MTKFDLYVFVGWMDNGGCCCRVAAGRREGWTQEKCVGVERPLVGMKKLAFKQSVKGQATEYESGQRALTLAFLYPSCWNGSIETVGNCGWSS
jgi:hypothetical protein